MPLKIAACVLNQWALDFTGNAQRIEESIVKAKADGAFYCLTPELSLTSYGCGDHFYESDTLEHSWRCLAQLLHKTCFQPCMRDIICDIGMPVRLDSNHLYNCRVAFCNGQILVIRPSLELIDTGIRRESRWFTGWSCDKTDDYTLPPVITQVKNQTSTVVGNFRLRVKLGTPESAVIIGFSTCQESWLNKESRSGIDILVNASASHYEIGKFDQRVELAKDVSSQCGGGLYVWTNLQGCDSGQLCYDGGAMAALDGQLIFTGPRFTWTEVGVNIITIDFDRLRSRPVNKNVEPTEKNDSQCPNEKTIDIELNIGNETSGLRENNAGQFTLSPVLTLEQELALGPALWLWDVLRRSGMGGLFLCLSGGLDSTAVACIVYSLCEQVCKSIHQNNQPSVLNNLQSILRESSTYRPQDARELCNRLFTTCFMPSQYSSEGASRRATSLARAINSRHLEANISNVVDAFIATASNSLGLLRSPQFISHGGQPHESTALQNVQARSRMTLGYLLAQLSPSGLLLLGSANLDEGLTGYYTKYDCSSADFNPIGDMTKAQIRRFVRHCANNEFNWLVNQIDDDLQFSQTLLQVLSAAPSAELMPSLAETSSTGQTDEQDLGLTYAELELFGRLRRSENLDCCGPSSMLTRLVEGGEWRHLVGHLPELAMLSDQSELTAHFAVKVKLFFHKFATSQHKTSILTPALHISCHSNAIGYDVRPIIYPPRWSHPDLL